MKLVALKQGGVWIAVNIDQVEWAEAFPDAATRVHFASGTHILVDEPLKDVVEKLNRSVG